MFVRLIQEHELLADKQDPALEQLSLVSWDKPFIDQPWGYYASYFIGAEWVNADKALVVTTKKGMENIDFIKLFTTCFFSNLALQSFSDIYTIDFEARPIYAPSLKGILGPLITLHFIGVLHRIKDLKKGYISHTENLKKVKGHIDMLKNQRKNIMLNRMDRVYCRYDEYTVDIPENRLLKRALSISENVLKNMLVHHADGQYAQQILTKETLRFQKVSDHVLINEVKQIKGHKLFKEYAEAIRLAKLIITKSDFGVNSRSKNQEYIPPFRLDMSLLYEHYVYGLLHEAYGNKIIYQAKGETGYPDFLYRSVSFKAICDTKYIPRYEFSKLDINVVRQLSGYSRDITILKQLGLEDISESSTIPSIPCIIIYPKEGKNDLNPFKGKSLKSLCDLPLKRLSQFYKICVPLPCVCEGIRNNY